MGVQWKIPGRWSVDTALEKLADPRERHRTNAAIWVWARDPDDFGAEQREALIAALRACATTDSSAGVRNQAVSALAKLKAPGATELVLGALRDPDPMTRYTVASQLARTGDPLVVDQLIALVGDDDGYVRQGAALALAAEGDPRAIEALQAMLDRGERDTAAKKDAKRALALLKRGRSAKDE
jgi:HEAT repeat protein